MTISDWPARLELALATNRILRRARVVAETASTQTIARDLASDVGLVVIAGRQTRGLGRAGQTWIDTRDDGVALTAIVADASAERLALASAVAVAEALESFLGRRAGIKWPNDVVVDGGKLAGILIERVAGSALVGIGANVGQVAFPAELAQTATSLAMLGIAADRCDVIASIVRALDAALIADLAALRNRYHERDVLRGATATLGTPTGDVTGQIVAVDFANGLTVRTAASTTVLPAATTTVRSWRRPVNDSPPIGR